MAPRGSSEDPKVTALRESRCLNPHPEQVTDPAFLAREFFDARDAVQVKYEMVRRVAGVEEPVGQERLVGDLLGVRVQAPRLAQRGHFRVLRGSLPRHVASQPMRLSG